MRTGMLRPGERIVETTLATELGVSRGPHHEALKALEVNHLVESRRNQGTYVAQITPAQAWQMVTVRALLEGLAARICVNAAAGRTKERRDEDWQFHELVCRVADNEFLLAVAAVD